MIKVAIYRVITGGYDEITHDTFNIITDSNDFKYSYFFISDQVVPIPSPWQFIKLKRYYKDPAIDNRALKLKLPDIFESFDYSIYIDGNIIINKNNDDFMKHIVTQGHILYAYPHYRNPTLQEEIIGCFLYSRIKLIDVLKTRKLLKNHLANKIGFECGILVRKTTSACLKELGDIWFNYYLKNAKRDQFYFIPSLTEAEIYCQSLGVNNIRTDNGFFKLKPHKRKLSFIKKVYIVIKVRVYNIFSGNKYA